MKVENIYQQAIHDSISKKQLYKNERFHVLLLQMKEGELLKTHTSPTDAFLLVLDGDILFLLVEKEYLLKKGDSFTFRAGEKHAVQALTDTSFLLVK
ncbi:cupin domain-containing protein [Panacibacter ginsenosidivorans]|uniref:Cupin domain-containing protein n=1 Tax=Panacibacter ginsenosidivorans TaxID=1813871 RepID=A0A5B8V3M2_9BACT|nr:cupin domain-containing protein [Panacibacter ginsenosidivorans]QEC65769.1 cupin domain-containing protein [Panacibacter ginsenosidivorans]QEC70078.1 cupin domain-containing protein [Panacibacter ginsenosidivorans]